MPSVPVYKQTPEVVFQPRTARGFKAGMDMIVDAIRPTLGPYARAVAIERAIGRDRSPELLDSGGVIARRVIELSNPDANAGAMFIRGALWDLHERIGDGVATAAILFQSIFNQGLAYIAAGGNAMLLRGHLETGMDAIIAALDEITLTVSGRETLAGVARTVCHDKVMADALGEIFSFIGEFGILEIRSGRRLGLEREFIEGSYWDGGLVSKTMISDIHRQRTLFENASILISDLEMEDTQDIRPVLEAAVKAQTQALVIVAAKVSEKMQGLIYQSVKSDKLRIIAVKAPGMRSDVRMGAMEDIARLTGGQPLYSAAGDTFANVTPEHLGRARRIWANMEYLGIVNGMGDARKLRDHVHNLRAAFDRIDNSEDRKRIQQRLGRLYSGAAAIDVGGVTETEMETRKEIAKRTAEALRGAVRRGVLPGGGMSLLACRPALSKILAKDDSVDARAAHRILSNALGEPFRAILTNSGYNPGVILSQVEEAGPGFGFDVTTGEVCEMIPAGVLDVSSVQRQAVISAIRSAAMALTIDVLIHRKKPPVVTDPDARGT